MVVATLLESGIQVPDETVEAIVDKARLMSAHSFLVSVWMPTFSWNFILLTASFFFVQTFQDADADRDDKISNDEWKAFVFQHPTLLKNMTLPYLKYLTALLDPFPLHFD